MRRPVNLRFVFAFFFFYPCFTIVKAKKQRGAGDATPSLSPLNESDSRCPALPAFDPFSPAAQAKFSSRQKFTSRSSDCALVPLCSPKLRSDVFNRVS